MNFFSVKEFFYKLNTIGFILLLLPLVLFVYLYFHALTTEPAIVDEDQQTVLFLVLCAVAAVALTIVHLLWRQRVRRLKTLNELAIKMDGFFVLVVMRNGAYAAGSLIMAMGFYLTEFVFFTGAFLILMLALITQWPTPGAFCKVFNLRGLERDMVLNDRDLPGRARRK